MDEQMNVITARAIFLFRLSVDFSSLLLQTDEVNYGLNFSAYFISSVHLIWNTEIEDWQWSTSSV